MTSPGTWLCCLFFCFLVYVMWVFFFFFQAEDGIRDGRVTGVQTCALPISLRKWFGHDPEKWTEFRRRYFRELRLQPEARGRITSAAHRGQVTLVYSSGDRLHNNAVALQEYLRSEERRVGKECRSRWGTDE